jgi:hypothetical protein
MALQFTAEDHKYTSVDPNENIDWLSVTSFVALFKHPFDREAVATKASKNPKSKWYGLTVDEIVEIWSNETTRAITLGSWYHDQREEEVIMCDTLQRSGIDLPIVRPLMDGDVKLSPDQSLVPGIYPEHLVYLKSAKLCGQADRVEVVGQQIDLYDYKTNKKIDTESWKNWEGVSKKMLGPLSHLDDCNLNHYALQLSTYMYMMQKHNHQLKPGKIQIHHIIFEVEDYDKYGYPITAYDPNGDPIVKEVVPYDLPYYKSEVRAMIKWIKQNPEALKK